MNQLSSIVVSMFLAQSAEAILLALVLYGFYRLYNRGYLLHWARSWSALCIYLAGAGLSFYLSTSFLATHPLRLIISTISLLAGYLQIAWLLFGTYEINSKKPIPKSLIQIGYLSSLILALILESIHITNANISEERLFHRVGVRSLIAAIAFFIAFIVLLKTRKSFSGLGNKLVMIAFLLYSIQHTHYFITSLIRFLYRKIYYYVVYFGYADFIIQLTIGLGLVIWFLEEEQKNVLKTAEKIELLSIKDSITELPNFKFFTQKLEISLIQAKQNKEIVAIFFVDLDRFKKINESLGHSTGDKLLHAISDRLRTQLSFLDLIARFGGDEFCIFSTGIKSEEQACEIAEKLIQVVRTPFIIQNNELFITATIGISIFPKDGTDTETLIKNAAAAMTNARAKGYDRYEFFNPNMHIKALEHLELETALNRAVLNNEFMLYYQPIINIHTNEIEEMEGLLRWNNPEKGILLPRDFLFVAESTGLIDQIELWALKQICYQIKKWHNIGYTNLRASVNLCAKPFHMQNLTYEIKKILQETNLDPSYLQLEITETIAMQNAENTLNVFHELKKLGVKIAIDDFGTGYSSLSYLHYFPIDTLKIDQSFIQYLDINPTNIPILLAIIALSHSLNLTIVAEGVETIEQLNILKQHKCDKIQGFLYSKPKPAHEFNNFDLSRIYIDNEFLQKNNIKLS